MTTPKLPRREHKLSEMNVEHKNSAHHISTKKVNLKVAEGGVDSIAGVGATMAPSDEQLEKINRFTRVEATADNVVAFTTMACNDIYDRDDERFTTSCVDAFAKMEAPYSPVGKSYMVDHEYKMANARGRIFDAMSKTVDGNRWLTCDVFVPKTPQYADFIEAIDFGINWAVSVGVVIDAAKCSICGSDVYMSRFFGSWCEKGHDKGYFYVPGEEETDSWGYFVPVDPSTKGAVKAMVDLSEPRDFYELSQVFLGAQYMAELAKKPGFKGMLKAASAANIPVLGLKHDEAPSIKFPEEVEQVIKARSTYAVDRLPDGSERWTDAQKLVWLFDPEDGKVTCLGKSSEDDDDFEESGDGTAVVAEAVMGRYEALQARRAGEIAQALSKASEDDSEGSDDNQSPVELAEQLDSLIDEAGDAIDSEDYDQASNLLDTADDVSDDLLSALGGTDADEDDEGSKAVNFSSEDFVGVAKRAGLGSEILVRLAAAPSKLMLRTLVSETKKLEDQVKAMESQAVLGIEYLAETKATAISWFTKSRMDPKSAKGVDVTLAQKLIDRCGDDVALIKELGKDWESEAKRRFPTPRRQSAFGDADDPNDKSKGPEPLPDSMTEVRTDPRVGKLHSH